MDRRCVPLTRPGAGFIHASTRQQMTRTLRARWVRGWKRGKESAKVALLATVPNGDGDERKAAQGGYPKGGKV